MSKKITFTLGITSCLLVVVAGCATQATPSANDPPGFLLSLVHGAVAPLALVAGIFTEVRIYAFPNSGLLYDFGFLIGLSLCIRAIVGYNPNHLFRMIEALEQEKQELKREKEELEHEKWRLEHELEQKERDLQGRGQRLYCDDDDY